MNTNHIAWSGALLCLTAAAAPLDSSATPLKSVQWKNRPLLVFAPSPEHPLLARQRAEIGRVMSGMIERDMIVVEIVGNSLRTVVGRSPSGGAVAFRRHYGVGSDAFRIILVGKDGGRKLVSSKVVSSRKLFGLIDSMPMRRDEIRRKQ